MSTIKKAFKSTNFTLQSILPLVLALGALIGFPETITEQIIVLIEGTVFTLIGLWGPIREFFKEGVTFRYTGNALAYFFAFLGGIVPWLDAYNLQGAIGALIEALPSGNFSLILGAGFAVINMAWQLFQDKPWQSGPNGDEQTNTDSDSDDGNVPDGGRLALE